MTSLITGRTGSTSATATRFIGLGSNLNITPQAVENTVYTVMRGSGTLSNLFMKGSVTLTGTQTYTLTVVKNGTPTSLAVVYDLNAVNSYVFDFDNTHAVSYVDGDTISIQSVPANSPTAATFAFSLENDATSQPLVMSADSTAASNSVASYYSLQNSGNAAASTGMASVIPTSGTISGANFALDAAPGSGKSRTMTLVKNGVDTSLVVAINDAATTNSSSTTVSVVAGDVCYWRHDPSGTPAAARPRITASFIPNTDGYGIYTSTSGANNASATAANYNGLVGGNVTTGTGEANRNNYIGGPWLARNLYVNVDTAPSGGSTWASTYRSAAAATALVTPNITAGNNLASDTTNIVSITAPEINGPVLQGASTPTVSTWQTSVVLYRPTTGLRVLNVTQGQSGAGVTEASHATTIPSTTSGSILVTVIENRSAGTSPTITSVTDNNSNTHSSIAGTGTAFGTTQGWFEMYVATTVTAGTTQVTVTPATTANISMTIFEIAGADTTTPVDVVKQASGSSTAIASGTSASTANATEIVIGSSAVHAASTTTHSTPIGYGLYPPTGSVSAPIYFNRTGYRYTTATGTFSWSSTLGATAVWGATLVTIKQATAASGRVPMLTMMGIG